MKKALLVSAILFQFAALLWMALSREYVVQTGEVVKIQTAPIDPRDLFRGDFVRLDYDLSNLPAGMLAAHLRDQALKKGQVLYVSLQTDQQGLAKPVSVSEAMPESGQFIKGRLIRNWKKNKHNSSALAVKYGIEQYFVEQGKGLDIEERRGKRNELQTPMIMHIALSGSGTAIIKDYEWGDFGVKLSVERQPERNADNSVASAIMKMEIKNVSDKKIYLPLKPGNCSMLLQTIKTAPEKLVIKDNECNEALVQMVEFEPDDSRIFSFDLNQSKWYVMYKGEQTTMGKLPWQFRFRIFYDEKTENINGEIVSQAFHGRGQVD